MNLYIGVVCKYPYEIYHPQEMYILVIYTPSIQQSVWTECYNHVTNRSL